MPKDLAVLGFDDNPIASLTNPEITTIHQPIEEMGDIAAEILLANIEGKSMPKPVDLETKIVYRQSI